MRMAFFIIEILIYAWTNTSLSLDLEGEKTYSAPIQSNILLFLEKGQSRVQPGYS